VAICDDSVQADFVEIRCLQLQHLMDAFLVDLIRCLADLLGCAIRAPETSLDELLTVLVEQVECVEVGTSRDLDQLGEAVSDLCDG